MGGPIPDLVLKCVSGVSRGWTVDGIPNLVPKKETVRVDKR